MHLEWIEMIAVTGDKRRPAAPRGKNHCIDFPHRFPPVVAAQMTVQLFLWLEMST